MTPRIGAAWRNVSAHEHCPICGKADWCSLSADGTWAICRREDRGDGIHHVDDSGADYWAYPLTDSTDDFVPPAAKPKSKPADVDRLHEVYSWVLGRLSLTADHEANLKERGLDQDAIKAGEYRSFSRRDKVSLVKQSILRFGGDALLEIPGFSRSDTGAIRLGGADGLLIPVRDLQRRIVALKVRSDGTPKYTYLSSAKHGGPSPGAPVHIPLTVGQSRSIRVTEGELKADVATALSPIPTIAIAGVSSWRAATEVFGQLGAKRITLSFDADWRSNKVVRNALRQAAAAWTQGGYVVDIELWDGRAGKGIDDVLVAGGQVSIERWEGVGQVVGSTDVKVDSVTIYNSTPSIVELVIGGHSLRLSMAELLHREAFALRHADALHRVPLLPSGKMAAEDWRCVVNEWMAMATTVEQSPDADDTATLEDTVTALVANMPVGETLEDLDKGRIVLDSTGEVESILSRPFEVAVRAYVLTTRSQICFYLSKLGWKPERRYFVDEAGTQKQVRVWSKKRVQTEGVPF